MLTQLMLSGGGTPHASPHVFPFSVYTHSILVLWHAKQASPGLFKVNFFVVLSDRLLVKLTAR